MDEKMSHYVIRGGQEGKRRLEVLARVMWPATFQLLKTAGIREGMICLDLGCGGGDVTIEVARPGLKKCGVSQLQHSRMVLGFGV